MRALTDALQVVSETGLASENYATAVYDAQAAFDDKSRVDVLVEIAEAEAGMLLGYELVVHIGEVALLSRAGFHDTADVESENYSKGAKVLLLVV